MLPAIANMLQTKLSLENAIHQFVVANIEKKDLTVQQRVNEFYTDVERYVAQQFIDGKINSDYVVRPYSMGIEVIFTVGPNCAKTTFITPDELRWTVSRMIPRKVKVEVQPHWDISADQLYRDHVLKHASPESEEYIQFEADHNNRKDRYGHLTKAEEESYKEVQLNGNTWLVLPDEIV